MRALRKIFVGAALGAAIGMVQVWGLAMYCTLGVVPVYLYTEGWPLALRISGFGALVGSVAGGIAGPPLTARNLTNFAIIIFASVLLASIGLLVHLNLAAS